MYYSLVIVLVNVCFDRLGALNVHQVDLYSFENELVCMMFLHLEDDLWRMGQFLSFPVVMSNPFSYSTNISEYCVL